MLPGECRKGTETSIHGGEDVAQVVQVGRIMQAAKMGQWVPLVHASLLPFSPSPLPDLLRSCSSDPPAVQLLGAAAGLHGLLRSSLSGWVYWWQGGHFLIR